MRCGRCITQDSECVCKLLTLGARLRPLADRVIVSRIEYKHPTLAVVGVMLQKGLVIAVGPGKDRRRKTRFEGVPGRPPTWFEDGEIMNKPPRPNRVKPGDYVEFSFRKIVEWEFEGVPLLIIKDGAIYGTTNASQSSAMLWQQSAGYDRNQNFMSGAETPH